MGTSRTKQTNTNYKTNKNNSTQTTLPINTSKEPEATQFQIKQLKTANPSQPRNHHTKKITQTPSIQHNHNKFHKTAIHNTNNNNPNKQTHNTRPTQTEKSKQRTT